MELNHSLHVRQNNKARYSDCGSRESTASRFLLLFHLVSSVQCFQIMLKMTAEKQFLVKLVLLHTLRNMSQSTGYSETLGLLLLTFSSVLQFFGTLPYHKTKFHKWTLGKKHIKQVISIFKVTQ